ncbi:MAG: hypothetical protein ABR910_16920 [Acidobacteriaceae bacterium]|jgi:hypothetical protein
MTRIANIVLCTALAALPASSQVPTAPTSQAQVTFYSTGSFWKTSLPGYKYGDFKGRIMDEYDQLAMLSPGEFVTFNLDPGPHTFSNNSWMIPRPEGGGHVEIDLVAGQHYYVATFLRSVPIGWDFRMEQRTCQQAQLDNKKTKPLDRKHLKEYGAPRVVSETTFPACP